MDRLFLFLVPIFLIIQVIRNAKIFIVYNERIVIRRPFAIFKKAFDVVYKMRKDILPQYDSQMELFETKSGHPVLSFEFYYDSGDKDDNAPF